MLDAKTLAKFKAWGRNGGKAKAKKYSSKQISNMAKRGLRRRKHGA